MKKWSRIIFGIAFSFMFAFIAIGYAALTDTLSLWGRVDVTIPEGLFIVDISVDGTAANIDYNQYTYLPITTTVDANLSRSSGTGTVKYKIKVFNNTKRTYAYRDLYYQSSLSDYNGQGYISTTNGRNKIGVTTNFPNGTKVAPGEYLEFYATYTVGAGMRNSTNWRTLINFQFGINVDSVEEAREAIVLKFLNILNSPATYETLCERIDDKFNGAEWSSNYIGNVTGSYSDDSTTVNELFAGQLQMHINGQESPVTVMIKRENVDGDETTGDTYTAVNGNTSFTGRGCEFTMYMTTDKLDGKTEPEIYAAVYTCDQGADGSLGAWYLTGEHYYGTATINSYDGGTNTGSFDTGTWRSYDRTYTPVEGYSYHIPKGQTIQQVTQTVDPNAIAFLQEMLIEAKKILDENIYAGSGMEALEDTYFAYAQASKLYAVDADGNITVKATATRSQIVPHLKTIANALKAFEGVQP